MRTLREWRTQRLWSQRELAAEAGVTQATIVAIERRQRTPNYRTMRRVSEALQVAPEQVIEFVEALEKDAA